ncbi:hypothetical protein [Streptosporangium sp. NPDC051022]|uniref:hypothetical protein n=1 Tax=Streptosporangium sp. NPDC051022 TaxID=3155752 RepID=UPI0034192959
MSNISEEWAMYHSPVKTPVERLVLVALAQRTGDDGCDGYKSAKTLAKAALCHPDVASRTLRELKARGIVKLGDQRAAEHIAEYCRPVVYDIQIPYSWYSAAQMEHLNQERAAKGRAPLMPSGRPDLAPAPERTSRSDKGKKAPQRRPKSLGPREEVASDEQHEGTDSQGGTESPGGLTVTGGGDSQSPEGGTLSHSGGDSESNNSLRELPGVNSSSSSDSFANAQESAGEGQQASLLGDDDPTPAPKKTSRKGKTKERTEDEQARFDQAHALATGWWERCEALGIPNIKRSNTGPSGFVGFRAMLERALASDCTVYEIKCALDSLRTPFPSVTRFQDAVAKQRGIASAPQSNYGKPPKPRVHNPAVDADDRAAAAAAFGETPSTSFGASW